MRHAKKLAPYLTGLLALGLLGAVIAAGVYAENQPALVPTATDATTGLLSRDQAVTRALAAADGILTPEAKAAGVKPALTSALLATNGKLSSKEDVADDVPIWVVKIKAPVTAESQRPGLAQETVYESIEVHIDARPNGYGLLGEVYGPSRPE